MDSTCTGSGYPANCGGQSGSSGSGKDCTYPAKSCNASTPETIKSIAESGSSFFGDIAKVLLGLTGGGAMGLTIAALTRKFGATAQSILWGVEYALGNLGLIAQYISGIFAQEAEQTAKFSWDELARAQSNIDSETIGVGASDLVLPALAAIGGAIGMLVPGLEEIGAFFAVGGMTAAAVIAAGVPIFQGAANSIVNQQELLLMSGLTN